MKVSYYQLQAIKNCREKENLSSPEVSLLNVIQSQVVSPKIYMHTQALLKESASFTQRYVCVCVCINKN